MLRTKTAKEPSTMTRKRTDIALHTSEVILSTLRDAARLTPLPFLRDAATLAVGIINAAQGARANKDALQRLANDAGALVCAIFFKKSNESDRTSSSRTLEANLEALVSTLKSIQKFAEKGASRPFLSRAMLHKHDLGQIQEYREHLRQALDVFGLRSTIELHENVARIIRLVSERRTTDDGISSVVQEPGPRETQREEEIVEGGNQESGVDRVMLQRDLEEGRETVQSQPAGDRHPEADSDTPHGSEPLYSRLPDPFIAQPFSASYSAHESENPQPYPDSQRGRTTSSIPIPPPSPPPPPPHNNPVIDNPFSFLSVSGDYSVFDDSVTNTNSGNTTTTIIKGSGNDSSVRIQSGGSATTTIGVGV
ncbi:hypothetical protein Hypma_004270 [Hypsizygus marmoreus]|uniref:Uncharacterized protein n=1 Tax=Hypsizygus marmoreus TaxID=39966 RepID=A0A369J4A3_HYPMA|nr:hypothetical protein Hypma_004270 [Hypsizygus marmoreus]